MTRSKREFEKQFTLRIALKFFNGLDEIFEDQFSVVYGIKLSSLFDTFGLLKIKYI